jgi:hypothetical protein
MLTRAYSYDLTVNSFGKAFASAKLIVDEEAHVSTAISIKHRILATFNIKKNKNKN